MDVTTTEIEQFYDSQSDVDRRTIALNAIERLIDIGEVRYRKSDTEYDGTKIEPSMYWESCGEDLRIPF